MKTAQEIMASKAVRISAIVVGILLVSFISFAGGLAVGFHKAKFSYAFGENYERNFAGGKFQDRNDRSKMMRGGMMGDRDFEGKNFRNSHGISGEIISVTEGNIIVKDTENKENTITLSEKTIIRSGRDIMKSSELAVGTKIVVIGNPSDTGTVNADFIRVFASDNTGRGWGMMNFGNDQQ